MDEFDTLLTKILTRVQESSLSDEEKADVYAEMSVGLRKIVWPILLAHMPEEDLKKTIDAPGDWSMDRYIELINKSLSDPKTPKEIYNELMSALADVDEVVTSHLPAPVSPNTNV